MKKIVPLLIFIVFSSIVYAGEEMGDLARIVKNDRWAVAEGLHNNLPLIIRFRNRITTDMELSDYPSLIRIFWEYEDQPSGMPSQLEGKAMELFEDRLVEALEPDLSGILTSVITTNGYREWVCYTKSVEIFSKRLHSMPQEKDPYPIQIEADKDQKWKYFFETVRPED